MARHTRGIDLILSTFSHEVRLRLIHITRSEGEQGLQAALQLLPRLVIADIHMPGLDGFQLLRVLSCATDGTAVPVILISASYRDPAASRLAGDLGAAAFVEAPYQAAALRVAGHYVGAVVLSALSTCRSRWNSSARAQKTCSPSPSNRAPCSARSAAHWTDEP